MRARKSLCICACLLLWGSASFAADKASRPAAKADLIGVWDMVSVKPVYDKTDPVFFPYQRLVFNSNSSMKTMSSEKPFTKEWLDKFQKQPAEVDYSLSDKGLLTLTWQSRPHNEQAICAYVLSDVPPQVLAKIPAAERAHLPKKGNITLSYISNEGKIAYQKIFKKAA